MKIAVKTRWWRLAGLASCGVSLVVIARLALEAKSPSARSAARLPEHAEARSVRRSAPDALPSVRAHPQPPLPGPVSKEPHPVATAAPQATQAPTPREGKAARTSSFALPAAASSEPVALRSAARALTPSKPRLVKVAPLALWSKPGLCAADAEASAARAEVTSKFRLIDAAERGKLYLDPRLPADAELAVFGYLDIAASEAAQQLHLSPVRPNVFVYFDQPLMRAAACINGDAVAFYDGALHVVISRADALQSIVHEYTHHALFTAGLLGPAWAQEGIAMHVANESWWRDSQRLQRLLERPFSMDDMDRSIPYKLASQQAVTFYVQSAALVECLLRERRWSLRQLFDALQANRSGSSDALTYDLPELEQSAFLRTCVAGPS